MKINLIKKFHRKNHFNEICLINFNNSDLSLFILVITLKK